MTLEDALKLAGGVGGLLLLVDFAARVFMTVRLLQARIPGPSTLGWILFLLLVPVVSGMVWLLVGDARIASRRMTRYAQLLAAIEARSVGLWKHQHHETHDANDSTRCISRLLTRLTGLPALRGNHLELIASDEDFLGQLVRDIDAAKSTVHLLYYIWEPDEQGRKIVDAVCRAARRGVTCRVLVDSVGSARLIRSHLDEEMRTAGALVVEALPASTFRAFFERVDLRNHRKIAVLDGAVAYCGSQNITHENFAKGASGVGPWIDATVRVRGPAVQALQATFAADWAMDSTEPTTNLESLVQDPVPAGDSVVQVVPSGPGPRPDAIHQAFLSTLYAAREELILSTPYFVPDEATRSGLVNAALRGVHVVLIVPARTDNRLVSAAARAHYDLLLDAGVTIYKHNRGLLHSKILTVDRELALIGSANFDMRSFWLNFEATLFVYDKDFTGALRFLQRSYMDQARPIDPASWRRRGVWQRFFDNCAQLLGPLL